MKLLEVTRQTGSFVRPAKASGHPKVFPEERRHDRRRQTWPFATGMPFGAVDVPRVKPRHHHAKTGLSARSLSRARGISLATFWFGLLCAAIVMLPAPATAGEAGKVRLVVWAYNPHAGDTPENRLCQGLMREDPDLTIEPATYLRIEGGKINSGLLSIAGGTEPDVVFSSWWGIRTDIDQGFLCPLNEYVGYDGFYGLHSETDKPYEQTGKPKLKRDPATGTMVRDCNGNIDDDEALWPYWRNYGKFYRMVATAHGRLEQGPDGRPYEGAIVYGLPARPKPVYWGIVYRRDFFRAAGFKEGEIPRTWDEFWYFCQKLTDPGKQVPGAKFQRGQRAIILPSDSWRWLQWVWSNGGSCILHGKTNPATGKTHWFPKEETEFIDPETGDSLALQPSRWKAAFGSIEAEEAVGFYQKLCWQPWVRNSGTGEPLDLTKEDLARGWTTDPRTNEKVSFSAEEVIRGVARKDIQAERAELDLFRRGEVAMMMWGFEEMRRCKVPPNNLSFMAVPAGPRGTTMVGSFCHYSALSHKLAGPARKRARDKGWKILSTLKGSRGQAFYIQEIVKEGFAKFLAPRTLENAGLPEFIEQIPPHWRDQHDKVTGHARAEPYMGNWPPAAMELEQNVLQPAMRHEDYDYCAALRKAEEQANGRLMFGLPEEVKARYRPWAFAGVCIAAVIFAVGGVVLVRSYARKTLGEGHVRQLGTSRSVAARWVPWLLLAPALASILLWAYYPLLRGSVMAFQDYRILGSSEWVGLDNFINVFTDPKFYTALIKTVKFAALSLGIGFLTPILLAVLLSEIPKGKMLFRSAYFLPRMSSGLVIMFVWKLMYKGDKYGLLNQLFLGANGLPLGVIIAIKALAVVVALLVLWALYRIAFVLEHGSWRGRLFFTVLFAAAAAAFSYPLVSGLFKMGFLAAMQYWATWLWQRPDFGAQDWLWDTRWTMAAVIVPGVWANAGMGSLIYLAALKNVDEESYEAADIDGAGAFTKAWYITIPYLKPLIIINFVGAFIGVFHAMGNIFVMTGGGPGDETTVISLLIWFKAFGYLRFGEATAMAWFLGTALIAFTIYQLRILRKVEFRRAEWS